LEAKSAHLLNCSITSQFWETCDNFKIAKKDYFNLWHIITCDVLKKFYYN